MADFSLKAVFGLDATGFKTEMEKLKGKANAFAEQWAKIGLAAAATTFALLAKGALDLAAKLKDSADALGINAQALQVLNYVAGQNGVSQETMQKALEKTRIGLQKANEGAQTQIAALATLGLKAENLERLPLEAKFTAIAAAYANSRDKAAAYNAVSEIFGERIGPKLMASLEELGAQGFPKAAESAERAGLVMSDSTIVALEKAEQAIQDFKQRATIAVGEILVNFRTQEGIELLQLQLIKAVSQFGGMLADYVVEGGKLFYNVWSGTARGILNYLQDGFIGVVQGIAGLINRALPDRFEINVGNLEEFKSSGRGIAEEITHAIATSSPSSFRADIGEAFDAAITEQKKVVDALNDSKFGKDVKALADNADRFRAQVKKGGEEAAEEIEEAIEDTEPVAFVEAVEQVVQEMTSAVSALAGIRTGNQFASATDTALAELVRRNKEAALDATNITNTIGAMRTWYQNPGLDESARLLAEAQNAQSELDMRTKLRGAYQSGGMAGVYRAFPNTDPLLLDNLVKNFAQNLTESQKTANSVEAIRLGLVRGGIIKQF